MRRTFSQEYFISKTDIQNGWSDKEFPRLARLKRVCNHQATTAGNIKGWFYKRGKILRIALNRNIETIYGKASKVT